MAIAYDNSTYSGQTGGTPATLTYAHTVNSNTNGILFVDVIGNGANANTFSQPSVTYNGVSMSFVSGTTVVSNTNVGVQWVFRLVAPASGANNVVVTQGATKAQFVASYAISYTGADQTNPIDQTATANSGTTLTCTATTTVNNDWGVIFAEGQTNVTASTGTTARIDSTAPDNLVGDSNGVLSTGSNSMSITQVADSGGAVAVFFSPAGATSTGLATRRTLLGVGI